MKSYSEIAGDGGSRVAEQVEAQRALFEGALSQVRHRVAIASGKGGVGKSTLTFALARQLAASGAAVAVLDADLNGPSQARLAGLGAAPLVPGERGLIPPRASDGFAVVSLGSLVPREQAIDFASVAQGSSQVWRATHELSFLGQLVAAVDWGRLDYLLIDLPPGAERTLQFAELFGRTTAFVLVTLPSALAHEVVGRSASALQKTSAHLLGWVENMSGYWCHGCREVQPLFPRREADGAFGVPCLGRVPFDPSLAGETVGPMAPEAADGAHGASMAIRDVARAIDEVIGGPLA